MPRRRLLLLSVACGLAGCGSEISPDQEVRTAVERFAAASAAKDYQALCDELLAPSLVRNVEQYGLPCELALKQGLGDVRDPKLTVGAITVAKERATAKVTTVAKGQVASTDTLKLQRVAGDWRIDALG